MRFTRSCHQKILHLHLLGWQVYAKELPKNTAPSSSGNAGLRYGYTKKYSTFVYWDLRFTQTRYQKMWHDHILVSQVNAKEPPKKYRTISVWDLRFTARSYQKLRLLSSGVSGLRQRVTKNYNPWIFWDLRFTANRYRKIQHLHLRRSQVQATEVTKDCHTFISWDDRVTRSSHQTL